MIPIKIQCGCGQRYAFEVEPVDGRMTAAVACPTCGADGTGAANAAIAQNMPVQPLIPAASGGPLRVEAHANHATMPEAPAGTDLGRGVGRFPGQIDRTQAEHEARAKISWGDPPEAVVKYLMMQGFSIQEASVLVRAMFQERAAGIRADGIKKIVVGILLICVPIAFFFIFLSIGIIPLKWFAITVIVGFWGLWMAVKGVCMAVSPRSQQGDAAEQ